MAPSPARSEKREPPSSPVVPLGDDDPAHLVTLLQSLAPLAAVEPQPCTRAGGSCFRGGFLAHRLPWVVGTLGAQSRLGQKTCLVQPRSVGLGAHVHHINSGGDETGQQQLGARLGAVPEAAAAGVPS